MSTFPLARRFEKTPSPQAPGPKYNVVEEFGASKTLAYKKYGFIEKASRFPLSSDGVDQENSIASSEKAEKSESRGEDETTDVEDEAEGQEENSNNQRQPVYHHHPPPKGKRLFIGSGSEESTLKLRRELDRIKLEYDRSQIAHDKEILSYQELLRKLETQMHGGLKDKISIQSILSSKEKEISDLLRTQDVLKSNLEKAERIVSAHQEKVLKAAGLQKKIDEMEKQTLKAKVMSERKLAAENEILRTQLHALQSQLDQARSEAEQVKVSASRIESTWEREIHDAMKSHKEQMQILQQSLDVEKQKRQEQEQSHAFQRESLAADLEVALNEKDKLLHLLREAKMGFEEQYDSLSTEVQCLKQSLSSEATEHSAKVEDLNDTLKDMENVISLQESELVAVKDQLSNLQAQTSSKLEKSAHLEDSLKADLRQQSLELADRTKELIQVKQLLSSAKEQWDTQLSHLKAELARATEISSSDKESLKRLLQERDANIQEQKARIKELERKVNQFQQSSARQEKELAQSSEALFELRKSLDELNENWAKESESYQQSLVESNTALAEAHHAFEAEKQQLVERIAELEGVQKEALSQNDQLCLEANSKIQSLEDEIARLNQVLIQSDNTVEELKSRNSRLSQSVQDYVNELHIAQSGHQDVASKIDEMSQELEAVISERNGLQSTISQLTADVADLNSQLKSSVAQAADWELKYLNQEDMNREEVSKQAQFSEMLEEQQQQLCQLDAEKNGLQESLSDHQAELSMLKEERLAADSLIKDQETLLAENTDRIQQLESVIHSANCRIEELVLSQEASAKLFENTLAEAKKEVEILSDGLLASKSSSSEIAHQWQSRLEEVRSEKSLLESRLAEIEEKLAVKEREVSGIQASLSRESSLAEKQADQIQSLHIELRACQKARESDREAHHLEWEEMKTLESKHSEQIADLRVALDDHRIQVQHLEESLQSITRSVESLELEKAKLTDELHAAQSNEAQLHAELVRLKTEFQECLSEYEHVKATLAEARTIFENALAEQSSKLEDLQAQIAIKQQALQDEIRTSSRHAEKTQDLMQRLVEAEKHVKAWKKANVNKTEAIAGSFEKEKRGLEISLAEQKESVEEKTKIINRLEAQIKDMKNSLGLAELRLANEVSTRSFQIKKLEDQIAELVEERDTIKRVASERRRELETLKQDLAKKNSDFKKASAGGHGVEVSLKKELLEMESKLADAEDQSAKWMSQVEQLHVEIGEANKQKSELEANMQFQLELLSQRGHLEDEEIKKLGEMNAELFGHANTRQKIKHVAQLKEENLTLKKDNLMLSRQRDDFRRRLMALERQMDSLVQRKHSVATTA